MEAINRNDVDDELACWQPTTSKSPTPTNVGDTVADLRWV
jgi:hypothetical protein